MSRLDIFGKVLFNYDEGVFYLMFIIVSNVVIIIVVKEIVIYGWEKNMVVKYIEKFFVDNVIVNIIVIIV